MSANFNSRELYPLVVRQSRYSGVYEGGEWIAIPNYDEMDMALYKYLHGDDEDFFTWAEQATFGAGSTPSSALADLYEKLKY
jgi:hypothetical protein